MWWFGGHLGSAVSALVDGQLDDESTERAWQHVAVCAPCRRRVEREGWVKRQLAEMAGAAPSLPPRDLLGSLYDLAPDADEQARAHDAWAAVERLEARARPSRRAGLAAVGVGSVSAAVLGLSTLGAAPLGIGNAPATPPTSMVRSTTPGPSSAASSSPFGRWLPAAPTPGGNVPVRSSR